MLIKKATEQDYEAFAALNLEVQKLHFQAEPTVFKPASAYSKEEYGKLLSDPGLGLFLGFQENHAPEENHTSEANRAVGYIFCEIWHSKETPLLHALSGVYIRHVAVQRDLRSKGIGTKLLAAVRKFADEHEISRIELDTWAFNTDANAFFKRNGFKPAKERLSLTLKPKSSL